MASTVAMFTGLSGLTSNARYLDVIGNNIANVNTTAYKSNRMLFASQFSRNFSLGSVPGESTGGTNPAQIGLGVTIAGTQRNFSTGSISATGDQRDLAVEGDGFFIVQRGTDRFYTRAGAFRQNSTNDLITVSGERVMGYGIDDSFNIVQGSLVPLNLPVGQLRLAEATQQVRFTGNLNAGGAMPSRGSVTNFPALNDTGASPITAATTLVTVDDPSLAGSQALFTVGQIIEVSGAEKGGKALPAAQYTVTAGSTVQDLMDFLRDALGIQTGIGNNPDGTTPGVSVTGGVISVVGNYGTANDLSVESGDFRVLDSAGVFVSSPFALNKTSSADGESIRTTFLVYDSLGNANSVDLVMALESRDSTGTTWRYFIESGDDTDVDLRIGTGTFGFDTAGRPLNTASISASIDRANTGAQTPLSLTFAFSSPTSSVTALSDTLSTLAATFQDGTPIGTLSSFSVGQDGVITGAFTNGLTRTIGQVALAAFSNPEGLVDVGSNLFAVGPNSGTPIVTTATTLGTGRIVGGSLELSNVDLAQEFINLILASTGYSASSRVITTTDQLLQQLLVLGR